MFLEDINLFNIWMSQYINTGIWTDEWTWHFLKAHDSVEILWISPHFTDLARQRNKSRGFQNQSFEFTLNFTLDILLGFALLTCWKQGNIYYIFSVMSKKKGECKWKTIKLLTRAQYLHSTCQVHYKDQNAWLLLEFSLLFSRPM